MEDREHPRAQVILATNNPKKLRELRAVVEAAELPIDILGLSDIDAYPEPAETERTFEGNALIKARTCALRTGIPALADDSGIEVDVLNNCPGVRSARWAGPECDDEANNDLLLRQISDVPLGQRTARFVCAMAFVIPNGMEGMRHAESVRREWSGDIAFERHGENGFGYDPIFCPDDAPEVDGRRLTSAELAPDVKNRISHRAQAVEAMLPTVAGLLNLKLASERAARPDEAPEADETQGDADEAVS
ncbi:non-canonical purine NTP pyrophosphatase [Luteococcus sp. H138]|uniref:non-canonical purine NTP pyrophosphatase n=1 Tax=unclassified Luteococcus TaxID=2639923 RepID=UPI00313CB858